MGSLLQVDPSVVLVTDGETRAALAVVRSLGRAGHAVHVASSDGRSLAGASRHARADHVLPDASRDPAGWAAALERLCGSLDAPLVVPITEVSLGTLYETGLDRRIEALCPDRSRYDASVDKATLMSRAAALGLDVPRTRRLDDPAEIEKLPAEFDFPVVVKARRSRFLIEGRWYSGGAGIATNEAELTRLLADPGMRAGALLQEFVPGFGEAIFALCHDGECKVTFAHRRLREKPPSGGVSVLRESIPADAKLLEQSRVLLRDLGWSGVAMVEFRRAPDGRAFLMEINPRFWGSLQLAIDAGADFPRLLVELHRTGACAGVEPIAGVRTRWLLGDVDHLLIAMRDRRMREATGRSMLGLLLDFVTSFFDGSRLEVLRFDDPKPFAREVVLWIRELFGGIGR
jgi:predicted ATP-grasp superfamily ATP-dependent carboligase